MDAKNTRNASGDMENSQLQQGKRQHQQDTVEQIHRLESYFKECSNPDENKKKEWSRELVLDPALLEFWIQSKISQMKAHNAEKEKLNAENLVLQEAIKSKDDEIQTLMMENAQLKEQIKNTSNETPRLNYREPKEPQRHQVMSRVIEGLDEKHLTEIAAAAMNELIELLSTKEPVWIDSGDGRCTLHRDTYEKLFPMPYSSSPINSIEAHIESSMDSAQVAIPGADLFQLFLDTDTWKDMFPTVMVMAKNIRVLDAGSLGGSIHLMYEKVHVLSPLVAPREFFLLRYFRRLSSSSWAIANVSFDLFKSLPKAAPVRSWKLPSGCIIEDLSSDVKSNVKWVEHIQVDEKPTSHCLYGDLVRGSQAYGATRWVEALRTSCQRWSAFLMAPIAAPMNELEGVIDSVEGRKNLMRVSHRMVKDFTEAMNVPEFNFSNLPELKDSNIHFSLRRNNSPGQPDGLILGATTSLWLPLPTEVIFNFFNNVELRALWDVLANGDIVNMITRISTGSHDGNCISIIQPYVPRENMLILQETTVDSLGATLVYAPIEATNITSVTNGEGTPQKICILPCGYVISSDGNKKEATGGSSMMSRPEGSLLTVVVQVLVSRGYNPHQVRKGTVAAVHSMMSATVRNIREALDCVKGD